MENRSLSRLARLTILTLGIYELVWLVQTRNEMVNKFGAKIPKGIWVVIVRLIQMASFLAVVIIVFYSIPSSNKNNQHVLDSRQKPAAECFAIYNQSAGCRVAIDSYYAPLPFSALDWVTVALSLIILTAIIWTIFISRWAVAYAHSVQKITKQILPANTSVLMIGGIYPLAGMLYIQSVFNKYSVK